MPIEKPRYFRIQDVPETTELAERIMLPWSTLNFNLSGLVLNRVTLLISGTNNGKSCFANSIVCNTIKQGYKVFLFAGEDGADEARDNLYRQYLTFDKSNFDKVDYYQNGKRTNTFEYRLKHEKFKEVERVFEDNLFIYNNEFPATQKELISCLEESYQAEGWRLAVIDNCEMFDLSDNVSENKSMKDICIALRQFAISHKVHLFIVCHIRKTERGIIRPDIFDTKGTSALTNISKNILSIIRLDTVDHTSKEYKSLGRAMEASGYNIDECDGVCEVLKTKGVKNGLVGLKFNKISGTYYEAPRIKGFTDSENSTSYAKPDTQANGNIWDNLKEDDEDLPF